MERGPTFRTTSFVKIKLDVEFLAYLYKPLKKNASLRELIIFLNSQVNKAPITYVTPINLSTCLDKYSDNFELVLLIYPLHLCILQKLVDSHNQGCFFPAILDVYILMQKHLYHLHIALHHSKMD